MDTSLLLWINGLPHPDFLNEAVLFLGLFGKSKVLMATAFLLALVGWGLRKKEVWKTALFFGLCIFVVSALVLVLKDLIHRPRPILMFSHLRLIGHAYGGSMPSGHAATFAAWAAFMILFLKRSKFLWVFIAFLGGLARVYQGAHYPSDVLVGWGLGLSTVWLIYRTSLRVKKE
ncbi:MAG: phosphatase PAP2 family protein [Candidatus Omnitrophica bacterium]|nr:phosphatase PAP2 family protein [Candidatus Omnitrophota bacterium]